MRAAGFDATLGTTGDRVADQLEADHAQDQRHEIYDRASVRAEPARADRMEGSTAPASWA